MNNAAAILLILAAALMGTGVDRMEGSRPEVAIQNTTTEQQ